MDLPILTSQTGELPARRDGRDDGEDLCRRCGASCHLGLMVGDVNYILPEIHCRFLGRDADGRYACTVYAKRFEVAPWCHAAVDAATSGNLATDCPYARNIPGFKGKVWAPPEVRAKLLPLVREKLIAMGLTHTADPEAVLPILEADGSKWTYSETGGCFTFHRRDTAREAQALKWENT